MVKMTEEKKVQNAAIKHATGKGIPSIRMFFGPGIQTGWPDVLFLIPGGRPLFIEFKAPGEEPTKKQEKKIKTLHELGYNVWWTDNIDEAKELIDDADYRARLGVEGSVSSKKYKAAQKARNYAITRLADMVAKVDVRVRTGD